jgi:hypothetical protein
VTRARTTVGHRGVVDLALRGITAAGLLVDAVLHLQLASNYQLAAPGGIGQGNLFRIEAVLAVLALLLVLLLGSRTAYAGAFLIAGGGLVALLVYRYYQLPSFGPVPSMYEPVWFFKKSLIAVAEAVAAAAALAGFLLAGQSVRSSMANH